MLPEIVRYQQLDEEESLLQSSIVVLGGQNSGKLYPYSCGMQTGVHKEHKQSNLEAISSCVLQICTHLHKEQDFALRARDSEGSKRGT